MHAIYTIPEENVEHLEAAIERLNRTAAKLGVPPIEVRKREDHRERYFASRHAEEHGIESVRTWFEIVIDGEAPQLTGWTFIGVIHHTEDGNIIGAVPGKAVPVQYRDATPSCDHCKQIRRRTDTFVLDNGTETRQVGRQCLIDFLGHADPHRLAAWAEALVAFESAAESARDPDCLGGGRNTDRWDLTSFLTITALAIRKAGWISRTTASVQFRLRATVDTVFDYFDRSDWGEKLRREWGRPTPEDRQLAEATVEWARSVLPESPTLSDYDYNLTVVARAGATTTRTAGIAASMIMAYHRAAERQIERQKAAVSRFVGEPGNRLDLSGLTVTAVVPMEPGMYGQSTLLKFRDAEGNVLVWFASETGRELPTIGAVVNVRATVKRHETRDGVKQTVLTRAACTLARDISTDLAALVPA